MTEHVYRIRPPAPRRSGKPKPKPTHYLMLPAHGRATTFFVRIGQIEERRATALNKGYDFDVGLALVKHAIRVCRQDAAFVRRGHRLDDTKWLDAFELMRETGGALVEWGPFGAVEAEGKALITPADVENALAPLYEATPPAEPEAQSA